MASPDLSRRVDSHDEDLRAISDTVIEIRDDVVVIKTELADLRRDVAGLAVGQALILAHLGIPGVTVADVDSASDAE